LSSTADHFTKVRHNEKAAKDFGGMPHHDWTVVVFFYAALHCVEAVFAVERKDFTSHEKRDSAIKQHYLLKQIFRHYKILDTLGRNARYYNTPIDADDVTNAQKAFDAIKDFVQSKGFKF
jgi:hypothetical protein